MSTKKLLFPILFLFMVITVLVVLWQLGYSLPTHSTIAKDWVKFKPTIASVAYKANGSFEATFQNTVGTSIKVTNITMEDIVFSDSPLNCTNIRVNSQTLTAAASVSVKAGDGFALTATCGPSLFAAEGDPFHMLIKITYTAPIGGVNKEFTETGRIMGSVEA
jgi:hypothetical protein